MKRAAARHSEEGWGGLKEKEEAGRKGSEVERSERTEDGKPVQVSSDRLGTSDTFSPKLTSAQQLVPSSALRCLARQFCRATHRLCVCTCFNVNANVNPAKASPLVCKF